MACLSHIKQNNLTYLGRVCTPCLSVSTGIYDQCIIFCLKKYFYRIVSRRRTRYRVFFTSVGHWFLLTKILVFFQQFEIDFYLERGRGNFLFNSHPPRAPLTPPPPRRRPTVVNFAEKSATMFSSFDNYQLSL